jgi:hypothetical protein
MKKTTVLRKAIMERRAVVVPACHDALSAMEDERRMKDRRSIWA